MFAARITVWLACVMLLASVPASTASAGLSEVDAESFQGMVVQDPAVWILEFFSPR